MAGDDDEEDKEAEEGDNDIAPEDGEQEGGVELPGKNHLNRVGISSHLT